MTPTLSLPTAQSTSFVFPWGGDSAIVTGPWVKPEWEVHATRFVISRAEDPDAWARANAYVAKHATLPIQVATEFHVQTWERRKPEGLAMSVNRMPQGDSVHYTVTANGSMLHLRARMAAVYIRTGRDAFDLPRQ